MRNQWTIRKPISCRGVGLHSGEPVHLVLRPAPVDTGIVFMRNGHGRPIEVRVGGNKVMGTQLCTTIGENGTSIRTVEHLLSSLSGLEVDNLYVDLDAGEVPILDGSAIPFVNLLLEVGLAEQAKAQPHLVITRPVRVEEKGKWVEVRPSDKTHIQYTIRFDHPLIATQTYTYDVSPATFMREIAAARTFGFLREVETLRAQGLAKGGSLENAVVIGDKGVINKEGLRYRDEFVRHKILDIIGDLALLGRPFVGEVIAHCSGHQLHTQLVTKILESPESFRLERRRHPRRNGAAVNGTRPPLASARPVPVA